MTERISKTSPRLKARIAGLLYAIVFVAVFALFTRSALVVSGDAAATASNILGAEQRFRLAFAADLVSVAAYIGVTAILYELLRPVSRTLALLGAFFGLAGSAIMAVNMVNHFAPLLLLGGASYLAAFEAEQLQALAYVSLRLHTVGYNISGVFFGLHLLVLGVLVLGATFLPRLIGLLLVIAGACYMTNSLAIFLVPAFAEHLYPYILLPGLIGEGGLTLWLILVGVNSAKWRAQAGAAGGVILESENG